MMQHTYRMLQLHATAVQHVCVAQVGRLLPSETRCDASAVADGDADTVAEHLAGDADAEVVPIHSMQCRDEPSPLADVGDVGLASPLPGQMWEA